MTQRAAEGYRVEAAWASPTSARNLEQALAERFDRGREWPLDIVYRETSTRGRLRTEAIFDRTARP